MSIEKNNWTNIETIDNDERIEIANDQIPYKDGSAREVLPPRGWSNNLKVSAPYLLRNNYNLFKKGYKGTPLKQIMTAPNADAQYALLMDWYKLNNVTRPTVKPLHKITTEERNKIREMRRQKMPYREIGTVLGKHHETIRCVCKDLSIETEKRILNKWSLKLFGMHFSRLGEHGKEGKVKQQYIRTLVSEEVKKI